VTFETATQIGVDLIAPACVIFTIWYGFRPWFTNHIGRAIMVHSFGSTLLFVFAALGPLLPEKWPGQNWLLGSMIVLWIVGWWYMVFALWMTRTHLKPDGVTKSDEQA
jgi:hypothetical protein